MYDMSLYYDEDRFQDLSWQQENQKTIDDKNEEGRLDMMKESKYNFKNNVTLWNFRQRLFVLER